MRNAIIVSWFSLLAGMAAAQQVTAPVTYIGTESTGIIGMTSGQVAHLNLLNLTTAPAGTTPAGCGAQVQFIDDQGTVQKTATVTVDAGKSMGVDYPYAGSSGREQFRVVVSVERPVPPPAAGTSGIPVVYPVYFCSLVPTLEIIDTSSSKTDFVVSDFHYVSLAYPLPLGGGLGAPTAR